MKNIVYVIDTFNENSIIVLNFNKKLGRGYHHILDEYDIQHESLDEYLNSTKACGLDPKFVHNFHYRSCMFEVFK